jgi:predicted transcriptional regulator
MFVSMRQYVATTAVEEAAARIEAGFVPRVREVEGFAAYTVVDLGSRAFLTITMAETRAAVEESAERARAWIRDEAADLVEGAPSVVNGRVLVRVV